MVHLKININIEQFIMYIVLSAALQRVLHNKKSLYFQLTCFQEATIFLNYIQLKTVRFRIPIVLQITIIINLWALV